MFLIFAYLTRDGLKSALIAVAKVVSTVAYGSANLFFCAGYDFIYRHHLAYL